MGDSSLHRFIMGNDSQKTALKAFNWISIVAGLVTIGAGVMGCVWGVKVLKPWPPLTWNNFVGGLFMIGFGFAIVWMALKESNEEGFFKTYFKFLDHLLGRGFFFLHWHACDPAWQVLLPRCRDCHLPFRPGQHRSALQDQGRRGRRLFLQQDRWLRHRRQLKTYT